MLLQIFKLINLGLTLYSYGLIIYVLMSWFPGARESAFGEFLGRIREPFLEPFRRLIPPLGGMLDLSPIIAIFVLYFARQGLWHFYFFLLKVV